MRQGTKMRRSTAAASFVMCAGLAITYLLLPEGGATAIFHFAAIGAALSIGGGVLLELPNGVRSLVRTDLVMIAALFALTLVEFFFPQEGLDYTVSAPSATLGVALLFLGFGGLIIGRNFAPVSSGASINSRLREMVTSDAIPHICCSSFYWIPKHAYRGQF